MPPEILGDFSAGGGNRKRESGASKTTDITAKSGDSVEVETFSAETVRDESKPAETAAENDSGPTDRELETAIVRAVTAGAFDVAKVLAARLEARRPVATVVDLADRLRRGR